MYIIIDENSGGIVDTVETMQRAIQLVDDLEKTDKLNGEFSPNRYKVLPA